MKNIIFLLIFITVTQFVYSQTNEVDKLKKQIAHDIYQVQKKRNSDQQRIEQLNDSIKVVQNIIKLLIDHPKNYLRLLINELDRTKNDIKQIQKEDLIKNIKNVLNNTDLKINKQKKDEILKSIIDPIKKRDYSNNDNLNEDIKNIILTVLNNPKNKINSKDQNNIINSILKSLSQSNIINNKDSFARDLNKLKIKVNILNDLINNKNVVNSKNILGSDLQRLKNQLDSLQKEIDKLKTDNIELKNLAYLTIIPKNSSQKQIEKKLDISKDTIIFVSMYHILINEYEIINKPQNSYKINQVNDITQKGINTIINSITISKPKEFWKDGSRVLIIRLK